MARRKMLKLPPAIAAHIADGGPTPLQVMQGLMKMHLVAGNYELAGRYAIEAAPYRHARALAVQQGELFAENREVVYRWQESPTADALTVEMQPAPQLVTPAAARTVEDIARELQALELELREHVTANGTGDENG